MISRYFNYRVILLVVLTALTSGAFFWTLDQPFLKVTNISLAVLWVLEVGYLLYVVKQTNRDLALFLASLKYEDDTIYFKSKNNDSFATLYKEFNQIIDDIRRYKTQLEIDHQYYSSVLRHVPSGLFSYTNDEKIGFINPKAESLLNVKGVRKVRELDQVTDGFAEQLMNLPPGKPEIIKVIIDGELKALLITKAEFKIEADLIRLLSIEDIRAELDAREIIAWQKLIRVLSHEIINSVSPISLLSSSLSKEFANIKSTTGSDPTASLKAIQKRSEGLMKFVKSYKSISNIPEPELSKVDVYALIQQVYVLMREDIESESIAFDLEVIPENLQIDADDKLVQQVLINLIKNSIHAVSDQEEKHIWVSAFDDGGPVIQVTDNGRGIKEGELEDIFLPFYTTREGGSGIGLNLSKQIMQAHKGTIKATQEKEGATFTLTF